MAPFRTAAFVSCILLSLSCATFAQNRAEKSDDHDKFQISTGIGISLTGFQSFTKYGLVDELGINYDTMSLLENETVRQQVGVSRDKYLELCAAQSETVTEMNSLVLHATYSEEHREKLEAKFLALESKLQSQLTSEQVSALEQARYQLGIEKHGLKYLAANDIATNLELSDTAREAIRSAGEGIIDRVKQHKQDLLKQANKELLEDLSNADRRRLETCFDDETMNRFLAAELFPDSQMAKAHGQYNCRMTLSKLRNRASRDDLKLSQQQLEKIDELGKQQHQISDTELTEELEKLLTKKQADQIFSQFAATDFKKFGTVNALSYGAIGQWLELAKPESERIFEAGKRIRADFGTYPAAKQK